MLYAFDADSSVETILLKKSKILELMYGIIGDPKYFTTMFVKSSFNHLFNLPKTGKNLPIVKYTSMHEKSKVQTNTPLNNMFT
jgi:hypothetical protein